MKSRGSRLERKERACLFKSVKGEGRKWRSERLCLVDSHVKGMDKGVYCIFK
jgi:hypothetical protein